MAKNNQGPDYSANTPEKNIEILQEKDVLIAKQAAAIADLEAALDQAKAKVAEAETELSGGIESFEVDGKTYKPTLPGIKHEGKIISFGEKFKAKQARQGSVVSFGDMDDAAKQEIIKTYPHIFQS